MRRLLLLLFMGVALAGVSFSPALAASTADPNPLTDACQGVPDSPTCNSGKTTTNNPLTGPDGTLIRVANIVALVAGIAAVIMIIISGIEYMTAAGDAQKAANARRVIIGAVVGLVVIIAARLLISIVIRGVS